MKSPLAVLLLGLVGVTVAAAACRKPAPAAPPPEQAKLPPLEVKKEGAWLFTYVDEHGQFATTDKADAVPEGARRLVRVIDPSKPAAERRDTTTVYVVDARELLAAGETLARPLSRQASETGAMAQLPPGASSLLAERPASEGAASPEASTAPSPGAPGPGPSAGAVVIVYGTSWCGACREARKYLAGRKIPFVDKDIEKDPAAAKELADKGARLGIPTDRVPILDVRGRLLIGFDRGRLEALLGEAT